MPNGQADPLDGWQTARAVAGWLLGKDEAWALKFVDRSEAVYREHQTRQSEYAHAPQKSVEPPR